jgi:hypothetical protein
VARRLPEFAIVGVPARVARKHRARVRAVLLASEDGHALMVPPENGSEVALSGYAASKGDLGGGELI